MCIFLATTAHPDYAIIILDNRDEFILRPTSRPHWWGSDHQEILSSRDLQRAEQGTWLGITKSGNFAVLTNYREEDVNDANHPVQGQRSRGGMVTAWLTAPKEESTTDFVHRLLSGDGVKGVGGFSLVCGKLRKHKGDGKEELEPLAIVSNRSDSKDDVPWIGKLRGEVYGLSNTSYDDPIAWPKVVIGKEKLLEAVTYTIDAGLGEEQMVEQLYAVLDTDTLPPQHGETFEEYIFQLRKSIFIPCIGQASPVVPLKADTIAAATKLSNGDAIDSASEAGPKEHETSDTAPSNIMSGIYGTQRQTIILVDWDGNVTFRERALWDEAGNALPRGQGDVKFAFKVEGWSDEEQNGCHPHSHM